MSFFERSLKDLREFDWRELAAPDTIGAWPTSVRTSLILLTVATVLTGGYLLRLRESRELNAQYAAQEKQWRVEWEQLESRAANLDSYRQRARELERPYMDMLQQLPYESEIPALIDDIAALGLDLGLEFRTIALGAEVNRPHYVEQPLDIQLSGGYHDLGAFFSGVSGLDRIVTLHDFALHELVAGRLEMNLQARTYRYRSLLDEPVAAVQVPSGPGLEPLPELLNPVKFTYSAANGRDPFTPSVRTTMTESGEIRSRRRPLEQYSLNDLTMVGLLKRQQSYAGLIRDPSGAIHRVEAGDYLGRNQGRIRNISEQGVELIEWTSNEAGQAVRREQLLEWNDSPSP